MEASYISAENRSSKAKTIAIVTLAVVGTFAACFLLFNQSASSTMLDDQTAAYDSYVHWKNRNNITFGGGLDELRFQIYLKNFEYIKEHKQKNATYTLGFTPFAALTREEFAATHLGYKPRSKELYNARVTDLPTDNLPENVDWREKGAVTPVKNQGQCGSCWAFSTTGALEGYLGTTGQTLVSLSEQELVDCSTKYGNNGCNGGLMDYGFKYVEDHGIGSEEKYPYKGVDGTCQKKDTVLKIKAYSDVKVGDADQLHAALALRPVSVAIEADTSDFQLYTGGVITGTGCGTQLDHGVLAVGYAIDKDDKENPNKNYYIVKNSWAASWGDQGYVKISAVSNDKKGVCGIQEAASYPSA